MRKGINSKARKIERGGPRKKRGVYPARLLAPGGPLRKEGDEGSDVGINSLCKC